MASLGLIAVRVLRRLPITPAFDAHLTRCAFAEALFDRRLTLGQVFGWRVLDGGESEIDASDEAIHAAMLSGWLAQNEDGKIVGEAVNFQRGTKTLQ